MPEYLAPGVFVEEVSFRSKSIEGVGTSVAGIVGPTRTGPLRGKPEVVTSNAQFERVYGDSDDLALGGSTVLNHTAIAARAFFDNGGKQLFVARTAAGVNSTDADGDGSTALAAARADGNGHVTFRSRFPGAVGDYTLELRWRDSENLLRSETTTTPQTGEVLFLDATGLSNVVRATDIDDTVPDERFPLDFRGLVRRNGDRYVVVANLAQVSAADATPMSAADLRPDGTPPTTEGVLMSAGLVAGPGTTVRLTRVSLRQPTGGSLTSGASAVLTLNAATDLSTFTGAAHWGTLTTLRGTLNAAGTEFTVDGSGLNNGVVAPVLLRLPALAAEPGAAQAMMVQRNFDIEVRRGGADGEPIYTYADISTAPSGNHSLPSVLAAQPARREAQLTSPVSCSLGNSVTGDQVAAALQSLFDPTALSPPAGSIEGPRYLIALSGGSDGDALAASDYAGEADVVKGSTGFAALEDIEDVSIVMTPAAAAHAGSHQAVVNELLKHCRKMRYRVGIVDSREGMAPSEVRELRANFDDSRLALYYPWVVTNDSSSQRRTSITVPPAGFIAGIYANTDVNRGVHKAPANEPVIGALRFAQDINHFQQELLNPNGINCLRSFAGRGHRVWGGRTLASDPEWKYVNVRRYFLYLERSIEKSTQWVVFEPNGERLWDNVRSAVEDFLYNEWFNGRLLGNAAKQAYFVRCDRSTMTAADIDNGRLVCLVGVAPLRPAEFVIFRIGQMTADSQG